MMNVMAATEYKLSHPPESATSLRPWRGVVHRGPRRPDPIIETVRLAGSTIHSGATIVARIGGENLGGHPVRCECIGPGFTVEPVGEHHNADGRRTEVALRVVRHEVPTSLCVLRFAVGPAYSTASITVRP